MKFDPFAQFSMKDHVALITGGAQNIGEAIARTFAAAGANVIIADLNGEMAEATAKKSSPPKPASRCEGSPAMSPTTFR